MAGVLESWIQVFVPQPCYDEFFVKFNFLNAVCLKLVLSKTLGYSIILGSVLVKLPQILKIAGAKSAEGISFFSILLELVAITAGLAYGFSQGYPFSAYGESIFLVIQTWTIGLLVLMYSNRSGQGALFTAVYVAILAFLLSPQAPSNLLWGLQASCMPNIVVARMLQAFANFRNQSTGQLSLVTVLLLFLGALARVFTSIQETGDQILIVTYAVSSACSGVLFFQILYYWNSDKKKQE